MEMIYVLTPKFGIVEIVDALDGVDMNQPYLIVFNLYTQHH